MAGGGWVDMKKKNLEEEEGRAEDTVGIRVIRRSVSLATTGRTVLDRYRGGGLKRKKLTAAYESSYEAVLGYVFFYWYCEF